MKAPIVIQTLEQLRENLSVNAKKVWVVTGPKRRFIEALSAHLVGMELEVFDAAEVHVPKALVQLAREAFLHAAPDVVIALGGGSAVGLAKALRLEFDVYSVAIPTTFAASEMTDIWGTTENKQKETGRDARVVPDLVVHDVSTLSTLPLTLKLQSLLNALAHPISALSTDSLDAPLRQRALQSVRSLLDAAEHLLRFPEDERALRNALGGVVDAGSALRFGKMGLQHRLAHLLGGRFELPHAALHALILPQFLMWLQRQKPLLVQEITKAAGSVDLPRQIYELLLRTDAPKGLRDLSIPADAFWELVHENEVPPDLAEDVWLGAPASQELETSTPIGKTRVLTLGDVATARHICVSIHGRGSSAQSIVLQLKSAAAEIQDVAFAAPAAGGGTWIKSPYTKARQADAAAVQAALTTIHEVTRWVREENPQATIWLAGFSQGACLALSALKENPSAYAGVFAPSGALLQPDTSPWPQLSAKPVYLALSREDPWVSFDDVEKTASELYSADAHVHFEKRAGKAHLISARDRRAFREMLSPRPAAPKGFGNHHEVELLPGALPKFQNSPRHAPYGLYPEQINGSGFVAPRAHNQRIWAYRVRPSAQHRPLVARSHSGLCADFSGRIPEANVCAWVPPIVGTEPQDFVESLVTLGGAGSAALQRGYALHTYAATRDMESSSFTNVDGDLLVIPQEGALSIRNELGWLDVKPGQIAVLPKGLRFSVLLPEGSALGYVGEVFGRHFQLAERGPVGANGLADARHFHAPTPAYEDRVAPGYRIAVKMGGQLFEGTQDHSPYDVVAWHGNYAPYVYDLMHFSPVGNTRFDHGDPSVYTVLSAVLDEPGAHTLDFVVFPPRWDATEHTFRPPFFHRNATTEINGIIRTPVVAGASFVPGMTFLTPSMSAHGVVANSADAAVEASDEAADRPTRSTENSLWFQLESALPFVKSQTPAEAQRRVEGWSAIWGTHRSRFSIPR